MVKVRFRDAPSSSGLVCARKYAMQGHRALQSRAIQSHRRWRGYRDMGVSQSRSQLRYILQPGYIRSIFWDFMMIWVGYQQISKVSRLQPSRVMQVQQNFTPAVAN